MNKLKKIIIILCIFIVIVMTLILIIKNNKEKVVQNGYEDLGYIPEDSSLYNVEYKYEKLRNPSAFFSVETCLKENINSEFKAKEMWQLNGERINSYSVYGTIIDEQTQEKEEKYYIVRVDMENLTFVIKEEKDVYSLEELNLETNITEITSNGDNSFEFIRLSNENICRKYLKYYNDLLVDDYKEAYKLLDDEYKEKRFSSNIENFKKYVEDIKDMATNASLTEYSIDMGEEKTSYVLKDVYNHYYEIEEDSIMNFTIRLDAYTIKSDEYKKNYSSLKEAEKTSANMGIFIQMINNKDYEHAYEKLANGFKNNYFKTQDEFETYIKNNWPNAIGYDIKHYSNEGSIYIYDVTLNSMIGKDRSTIDKSFNVKIDKEDDTNFEISFNVN